MLISSGKIRWFINEEILQFFSYNDFNNSLTGMFIFIKKFVKKRRKQKPKTDYIKSIYDFFFFKNQVSALKSRSPEFVTNKQVPVQSFEVFWGVYTIYILGT